MSDKSLSDKAIQIQGKDYVLVSDRIIYFNEQYPEGAIITELLSEPDADNVVVKAIVYPDGEGDKEYSDSLRDNRKRCFVGHSQAVKGAGFINKTAALENAETSAVGRALAMMGIGVIDSVASVDEINKAKGTDLSALDKAKAEVFEEFKKQGIDDSQEMIGVIDSAIGKVSITNVEDAKKVLEFLKKK